MSAKPQIPEGWEEIKVGEKRPAKYRYSQGDQWRGGFPWWKGRVLTQDDADKATYIRRKELEAHP